MDGLIKYLDKRIEETNKNLMVYRNQINELHRVSDPLWVKAHTNRYLYYHALLGELFILNEIKSKLKKDGKLAYDYPDESVTKVGGIWQEKALEILSNFSNIKDAITHCELVVELFSNRVYKKILVILKKLQEDETKI